MTLTRTFQTMWMVITILGITACFSSGTSGVISEDKRNETCSCDQATEVITTQSSEEGMKPIRGGLIRIRISKEPPSLMPLLDPIPVVRAIVEHDIQETLIRISDDGKQVAPGLAIKWTIDEDYKFYTFKLDPRARWHDGTPLTAVDVELTFSKILDPDGQVALRRKFASVSEVVLVDEYTITIELDRSRPGFLKDVSRVTILPAHIFDHSSIMGHSAIRKPMGSGPYRFVRWIPGKYIELERNPHWRGAPPFADHIEYWIIPDNRVALDLFRRGDLDIVPDLPGYTKNEPSAKLVHYPLTRFDAWVYNTTRLIFSRPSSRKAIGMIIDSEAIRCSIFKCHTGLLRSPWPLNTPSGNLSNEQTLYNPSKARSLLDEDGWIDRDHNGVRERGGIDLSFVLTQSDYNRDVGRIAAVVQDELASSGIEMKVSTVDFSTYLARLNSRNFDVAHVSFEVGPELDPWLLFHSEASVGGQNHGAFEDSQIDTLIDSLQTTHLDSSRLEITKEIVAKLELLHPMTFIMRRQGTALIAPHVHGFKVRAGWMDETSLWISAKQTEPGK